MSSGTVKSSNSKSDKVSNLAKCLDCSKVVQTTDKGVLCDVCEEWFHSKCVNISDEIYTRIWMALNQYTGTVVLVTR